VIGRFEQAVPVRGRTRERAALVPEKLALEERLGDRPAVDGDERSSGTCRLVVNESRDPFLAHPALAGNEHGGIDFRHPPCQRQHVLHLGALGDDPQRLLHVGYRAHQNSTVCAELLFRGLQGLGDPAERDIEALREASRVEVLQLLGAFVTPLFARTPQQVARRVTFAQTAIFEDVDLLSGGVANVATRQAANGPAHR
jgi:hypothetical protein